ncbi:uncharacterized protein [Euphorbia lathyris]|uniref:uncharacterized protein n=1 Tax=Euphorbia lathyris TaxID=212925 RepID=UPI0033130D5E
MLSQIRKTIVRVRSTMPAFKLGGTRHFCKSASKPTNNGNNRSRIDKTESSISKYDEAYRQLDKLDFMTATKILFNEPPKKKEFGIDFHLVQFFFVCMPSLAAYLVAQYARSEMRRMDAELERKKKAEEEKAKEIELKAIHEEEARSEHKILEVKVRLDKLEEAVKEIVVATKKHSGDDAAKKPDNDEKKHVEPTKSGEACNLSESKNEETAEK